MDGMDGKGWIDVNEWMDVNGGMDGMDRWC